MTIRLTDQVNVKYSLTVAVSMLSIIVRIDCDF